MIWATGKGPPKTHDLLHPAANRFAQMRMTLLLSFAWRVGSTECMSAFTLFEPDSIQANLPLIILVGISLCALLITVISKVRKAMQDEPFTPMVWERHELRPQSGKQIWSNKLNRALRRKNGAKTVHFKKEEFERFKVRSEIKPNDFIMVVLKSDGRSIFYIPTEEAKTKTFKLNLKSRLLSPRMWDMLSRTPIVKRVQYMYGVLKKVVIALAGCIAMLAGAMYKSVIKVLGVVSKQKHKVKIVLGMLQVMDGMESSFNLLLPFSFMQLIDNMNFLEFNLPLDCLFPVRILCQPLLLRQCASQPPTAWLTAGVLSLTYPEQLSHDIAVPHRDAPHCRGGADWCCHVCILKNPSS